LKQALPGLAVVLLSNHQDVGFLASVETTGWSYLHKKSLGDLDALRSAVRSAAGGLVVLDPRIASTLRPEARAAEPGTDRAGTILALLAEGLSNAAIADRLCLAERSVENQVSQLYRRLGIDTSDASRHPRVSAALAYVRGERV
jgi:DNA-binding NarL/FixJ family response regulator